MDGEDTSTLVIPTEDDPPAAVIAAWVACALRELPAPARLRAGLVARELVAGARGRHAAPYVVQLAVLDRRRVLAISVEDCSPAPAGGAHAAEPGLVVVAALSTRWGVEQRSLARTTWAELDGDGPEIRISSPAQPLPRPMRRSAP